MVDSATQMYGYLIKRCILEIERRGENTRRFVRGVAGKHRATTSHRFFLLFLHPNLFP